MHVELGPDPELVVDMACAGAMIRIEDVRRNVVGNDGFGLMWGGVGVSNGGKHQEQRPDQR